MKNNIIVLLVLGAGLLSGCGSDGAEGQDGANGLTTLIRATAEPAGSACASGGSRIEAGLDRNASGALDDAEVAVVQVVCNGSSGAAGSNGARALVSMQPEPAGAQCAAGGQRVDSGLDANANGMLDPSEVAATAYVCNGSNGGNGAAGTDGLATLLTQQPEPAGSHCAAGGTRISSGLDRNRNGTLEAGEVGATSYVCTGATGPAGASLSWQRVTTTAVQALPNTGYIADHPGAPVAVTLPAAPNVGDVVRVTGMGAGGWRVAQNAGQTVNARNLGRVPGQQWTARGAGRYWYSVAASSDGRKAVAVDFGGRIHTSVDSGQTWTPRDSDRSWLSVASSADGDKLVAVVYGGQIHTSTDAGLTWTAREAVRNWYSVASSADGNRLVACVLGGAIYTSTDGGLTWTPREQTRNWYAVASSADGSRLAAISLFGQIYTSADAGVNWTARPMFGDWRAIAISADGSRLAAVAQYDNIHVSTDGGDTWTARADSRTWSAVAMSADGLRLVAGVVNGQLATSHDGGLTWSMSGPSAGWLSIASSADGSRLLAAPFGSPLHTSGSWTSEGAAGGIAGSRFDAIELQYLGAGEFNVIGFAGAGFGTE